MQLRRFGRRVPVLVGTLVLGRIDQVIDVVRQRQAKPSQPEDQEEQYGSYSAARGQGGFMRNGNESTSSLPRFPERRSQRRPEGET